MNEQTRIILAYTHWLYNAESDFIEKAWKGDQRMIQHFREKLSGIIHRSESIHMTTTVLVSFDRELSSNNRDILYKFIIENHIDKW